MRRYKLKARHNKSGDIYTIVTMDAIDCTNERADTRVVVYEKNGMTFVREYNEFLLKFTVL